MDILFLVGGYPSINKNQDVNNLTNFLKKLMTLYLIPLFGIQLHCNKKKHLNFDKKKDI